MKYMTNGGFNSNPLMRLTLFFSIVLILGLWVTNGLLYLTRMGIAPESVVLHYLGSEEQFVHPRTFGSMIEVTHAHLATMTVVVLLLTHLAIYLPWRTWIKVTLIVAPFVSVVLGEGAGWLVRFVDPRFAILKVAAFLGLQISLLVLLVALGRLLLQGRASRNGHGG